MHEAVRRYVSAHLPDHYDCVIEVGSLDINGGVRDLLDPSAHYLGIDRQSGPGVGLVGDFCDFDWTETSDHEIRDRPGSFRLRLFDLVLCCEVLEHTSKWREIVAHAATVMRSGGTLIVTCATHGRAPHSARSEAPIKPDEFYENIDKADLDAELAKHFASHTSEVVGTDLRATAVR